MSEGLTLRAERMAKRLDEYASIYNAHIATKAAQVIRALLRDRKKLIAESEK